MAKSHPGGSFVYTFALIVRDQAGEKINGTVSLRDEEGTRRLAQEVMRLLPDAALVDVYLYGVNLETSDPALQVYREGSG